MAKKTLYLIDGFALIFRAYYAFINNPLMTAHGENTSAVFGFFRMLLRVLKEYKPTEMVIVFDSRGGSFRNEIYPEYKANRSKAPEDLLAQIPWIIDLVSEVGLPHIAQEGLEADDLIAAFSGYCGRKGYDCRILSGDKDLMQLVDKHTAMLVNKYGSSEINIFFSAEVEAKFGVKPTQMPDYLALVGDSSDNVPGVKGIGPKGAQKLLAEHPTLSEIYANLASIKPDGVKKKLETDQGNAELSLRLVTLDKEAELPLEEPAWSLAQVDLSLARYRMEELELFSLLKDPLFEGGGVVAAAAEPEQQTAEDFDYILVKDIGQLKNVIEEMRDAGRFAVDSETTSLNPYDADLLGISFSAHVGTGYYVPLGHPDNPIDKEEALALISPLLADSKIKKIGQNLKFECSVFSCQNIPFEGIVFDTMIAAYLLAPGSRCGLDELADRYLNRRLISYKDIVTEKGATLADVALDTVATYAAEDAEAALALAEELEGLLEEQELGEVFHDIEMPLVPILSAMELAGVALDVDHFSKLGAQLGERIETLTEEINSLAGESFNINSPKQMSHILFEKMAIPPLKKTKTGYSTNEEVLTELAPNHPIAGAILEYRKLSKLKNTYVDVLPSLLQSQTSRLHTSFNQTVTTTGRLSSSDPNLQNIPIKDILGREVRRGFVAAPGCKILSADYSQIELRVLAALSEDEALTEAYEKGLDIHARTAASVFDIEESAVGRQERTFAKTINFGVIYGLSAFGLAKDLGISRTEAKGFIDNYFALYSGVQEFIKRTVARAELDGYVLTWFGRKRTIPELASSNKMQRAFGERLAVNTLIQGTAADLIKLAMKKIAGRLKDEDLQTNMLLQVHDELLFEVPVAELSVVEALVREEMKSPWPFELPLEVGIGIGDNWEEAH